MMSVIVILLVVKFSRFLYKDKSENTFIKICLPYYTTLQRYNFFTQITITQNKQQKPPREVAFTLYIMVI